MEKAVAIPTHPVKGSIIARCSNLISQTFWSYRCRSLPYKTLLQKTVGVVEEVLSAHSLTAKFYNNINFEVNITTDSGWSLDLSKAFTSIEENTIAILYKDTPNGQITYSITFKNINGTITGIQNMFQGFCIDSYFHDEESNTLNPNVLAGLLSAKKSLSRGVIAGLKMSNTPITFGKDSVK